MSKRDPRRRFGYRVRVVPSRHNSGNATVIVDDRYLPVLISVWSGQANMETARWFKAENQTQMEAIVARGQPYVMISDASNAERPQPAVRKYFAELSDDAVEGSEALSLGNYVVITNAVIRGALTAIGWISERAARMTSVASMQEAIERALADLDAAGVPRPPGLDPATYRPPAPDQAAGA